MVEATSRKAGAAMSRSPRVTFVLSLHGGLVRGGLEIQAEATQSALHSQGWDVQVHQSMECHLGDLVHFFGTFDGYWDVARQCIERGVPYVCSPVFLPPVHGPALRLRALRKRLTDRTSFRGQRKLYRHAARLFTLTRAEVANLRTYFGSGLAPCVPVPNGVAGMFGTANPDAFRAAHPFDRPIVICTGRITDRKNQLAVVRACQDLPVEVVFFGPTDDAEYLDKCLRESAGNVHVLGTLPANDPVLASAYASAEVFCLPSRMEVLSLSALEAACAGAKLVLSDTWAADEFFGDDALYCSPDDVSCLRDAICAQLERKEDRCARRAHYAERYAWDHVAGLIDAQYRQVLANR